MTQWIAFNELKQRVTIEAVLEHYGLLGTLRRNGDSLIGVCPLPTHAHTSAKPNPTQFNVWLTKNGWHCFGDCQDHGNVYDFVAVMEGMDRSASGYPREPALKLMAWFGISFERPHGGRRKAARAAAPMSIAEAPPASTPCQPTTEALPEPTAEPPKVNMPLKFALKNLDTAHPYLRERGLTPATVADFGLGHCTKGIMANRIAIPIHNETGELVAYAGRWPGEPPEGEGKYKLPAGFHKSLVVYNLHRATELAKEKGLILVEGFFDCMRLWQAGYHNVAALGGSSMSEAQERLIREAVGPHGSVALMFDEDEAGWKCREDVIERLITQIHVRVIALGDEGTQPDGLSEDAIRAVLGYPSP